MTREPRCERNIAGPEEDIGFRRAYTPCGRPGPWTVDPDGRSWSACDEHADAAILDGCEVQP